MNQFQIVDDVASAVDFANQIGYPIIVRPAYTLGGTGGGIAENEEELIEIVIRGLKYSMIGQVLIERSVAGWKEVEYEVMRDSNDNCIVVCNMENLDPVGVHTGDSIVVAPSQTLTDHEYQMLRSASLRIIRELGIEGGCNAQFALDTKSNQYYVIEVNPRVSRSSALASKATGYPIAKVSAKIAIGYTLDEITNAVTKKTKADRSIAEIVGKEMNEVRNMRKDINLLPCYKMVDTCAAEFEAATPYYYSTFHAQEDEVQTTNKRKVIVLGSGPIRIGQGVEFDYCSVHSVWALRKMGIEAIIINNNPETVSTDFDISDRLYFEPLTTEDVLNIIDKEQPEGVIVQFGGQTAINLAASLKAAGVKVFGTSVDDIDRAEDRERFDEVLEQTNIARPQGASVTNVEDAVKAAEKIGYPSMVRPSYVLGGRAMEIVYNEDELRDYMNRAVKVTPDHPVLIDHYMQGTEVEVDAIADGETVVIPGIMEHIERAGVHSGDSIAVYPPQTLSSKVIFTIIDYTKRLGLNLNVKGLLNIQYVVVNDNVYVIEVNPRSSRTVPFLSKVTDINMVELATRAALGEKLTDLGLKSGLVEPKPYVALKAPVFSFAKMQDVDISLGPEMKSTGEVMGIDYHYARALYKAITGAGMNIPHEGTILFTVANKDKEEMKQLGRAFAELGFKIAATEGTAKALKEVGVESSIVYKVHERGQNVGSDRSSDIIKMIKAGGINMVITTQTPGQKFAKDGFRIRRATVEHGIACLTSLDTAWEVLRVLSFIRERRLVYSLALQDYIGRGDELA